MSDALKTYSGWTNRETWLVSLWLNNDEISYNYFRSILRSGDSLSQTRDIREYIEELMEDSSITLWQDVLREMLDKVNWLEIVSSS